MIPMRLRLHKALRMAVLACIGTLCGISGTWQAGADDLSWSATSGTWAANVWQGSSQNTQQTNVIFTGSGSHTVTVSGEVKPQSITIDSGIYVFTPSSDSAIISGKVPLTLREDVSLTTSVAQEACAVSVGKNSSLTYDIKKGAIISSLNTASNSTLTFNNSANSSYSYTINGLAALKGKLVLGENAVVNFHAKNGGSIGDSLTMEESAELYFSNASGSEDVVYSLDDDSSGITGKVYVGNTSASAPLTTLSLTGTVSSGSYHVYTNGNLELNGTGEFSATVTGNGMLTVAEGAEQTLVLSDGEMIGTRRAWMNGIYYSAMEVYERVLSSDKSIVINVEGTATIGTEDFPAYNAFADDISVGGTLTIYYRPIYSSVNYLPKYADTAYYISTDTFTLNGGILVLRNSAPMIWNRYDVNNLIVNEASVLRSQCGNSFANTDPSVGPTAEVRIAKLTGAGNVLFDGWGQFAINIFNVLSTDDYTGDITVRNSYSNCPYWTETFNLALLNLTDSDLEGHVHMEQYDVRDAKNRNRVGLNIASDITIGGLSDNGGSSTHLSSGTWFESEDAHCNDLSEEYTSFYTEEENTLTINAHSDFEFNGKVYGSLNLVKKGSGVQSFLGDMSSFNGSVEVQGGTLEIVESVAPKFTTINGGTLSSEGTITTGSVLTMASGTLNAALLTSTAATFRGCNDIAAATVMGQDWTLAFDVANEQQAVISFAGVKSFSISTLTLQYASDEVNDGDEYVLMEFDKDVRSAFSKVTVSGDCSESVVGKSDESDLYFTTRTEAGKVYYILVLRVDDPLLPPALTDAVWGNVSADGKWNTTSENWIQGEHTYKYKNGVNVLFADAASEEVTLEGVLTPASVCVNNSKGTTLTWLGSGSLSGDMMLTKQGDGVLYIKTANTYTGGTLITAGLLATANINALGTGDVTLNGGSLNANGAVLPNDIIALNGTLSNGANLLGKITVEGALTLSGNAGAAGGIELRKGSISGGSIVKSVVNVCGTGNMSVSSTLTGNCSLTIQSGKLTLSGNNSYTGGTVLNGGSLVLSHVSALGTDAVALHGGSLNLADKAVTNRVSVEGNAALYGSSAFSGTLALAGGNLTGDAIMLTRAAELSSGSVANKLTGSAGIIKSGSGTVTLSGSNSFTGGTLIKEGTLVTDHLQALGSGAVTLSGGTLDMAGKALQNRVNVASGSGKITNGGNYDGALTLTGGTLTVESGDMSCESLTLGGGAFLMDGRVGSGTPQVEVSGVLSITGAAEVGYVGAYSIGTHVLFSFGSLEGDIENLTLAQQYGKILEYTLYVDGNKIVADVVACGAELEWSGKKGTWTIGGGNWNNGGLFGDGDRVTFSQAATVTLQGNLAPSVIKVDSSQAVVFSGTGAITGTADLTKKGQGQLQLNAANPNWTGNIYLQGGTITATGNTSFGKGDIYATDNATLNLGGKVIDNDIYISDGATVGILGGNKFTGSVDVTGNLAVKSTIHIAEGESITLHSGKHSATVTGKGTMRIEDGSVTLQTGKYTMSQLDIASKLTLMKQGIALAKTDSFITITEGGSLVSSGNISGCHLSVWDGSINIRNSNPVNITLNGDFTAENSSSIRIYGALKSDSFTLNQSTFKLSGEKPQAITIKKGMSINGGTGFSTNGNVMYRRAALEKQAVDK